MALAGTGSGTPSSLEARRRREGSGPDVQPRPVSPSPAPPEAARLPARLAVAAAGLGAGEHVQKPMERGAFQRAVHLHDEREALCAAATPRPRRRNGRQGVLGADGRQSPGTHSALPAPRGHPPPPRPRGRALTGQPPSLLAVQAAGPLGQPFTAASRSPSSTRFETAAIPTALPRDGAGYGGCRAAPCAHARRRLRPVGPPRGGAST